jgi:hypothetical protein
MSVNKMSDEGYTTIFHPGEEGVTIHHEGSIQITMTKPPVLHGRKLNGEKLWTVSGKTEKNTREEASNVYSLPLIQQSVKYLHATASFPVKEEWLKQFRQATKSHGQVSRQQQYGNTAQTLTKHRRDR